jgi:hypothetical protein
LTNVVTAAAGIAVELEVRGPLISTIRPPAAVLLELAVVKEWTLTGAIPAHAFVAPAISL